MLIIRVVVVGAMLALTAIVGAIAVSISNQSLRQEVAARQQTINQGLALSQVNSRLINTLATVSARDNDDQIRALLAQQGITFKPSSEAPGPSPAPQVPPPAKPTK